MKNNILSSFILLFILATFINFNSFSQGIKVKTRNGEIEGRKSGEISIFQGVPFALPPVGDLRWKAPQPMQNWEGVKDCRNFRASPMQSKPVPFMMWTEEFISPPEPLSEDCLYLNIWTKSTRIEAKLPVFVWIYGGGFTSGSSACAIYDGEEYAKKSVVFVSINYRVGVFGFLAHPELNKESGKNASGNYGILDQIAALKWIKDNISAFGGDPGNVTIAGQSAGSMSVTILLASPKAKGLFQKAIAESGGIFGSRMLNNLNSAEEQGLNFMNKLSVPDISELRKITAEQILSKSAGEGIGRFGPALDGFVLPRDAADLQKENSINNVPIISGWVTGDAALMGSAKLTIAEYKGKAKERYGASADEFLKLFPANSDDELKASQSKFALLAFAGYPSYVLANLNKSTTYIYEYSHVPPDKPGFPNYGAFHTSEVPYALHTLHMWKRDWKSKDLSLEENMSDYWINFAKTGNPNGNGLPEWKAYERLSGNILEIGDVIKIQPGKLKKELEFLENNLQKK